MLYQCGDNVCIELSVEALEVIQRLLGDKLVAQLFPANAEEWAPGTFRELSTFRNELISEIQHRAEEAYSKGLTPETTTEDLRARRLYFKKQQANYDLV